MILVYVRQVVKIVVVCGVSFGYVHRYVRLVRRGPRQIQVQGKHDPRRLHLVAVQRLLGSRWSSTFCSRQEGESNQSRRRNSVWSPGRLSIQSQDVWAGLALNHYDHDWTGGLESPSHGQASEAAPQKELGEEALREYNPQRPSKQDWDQRSEVAVHGGLVYRR
jgi:hypothetical protein